MLDRPNNAMVRVWELDHWTMREYPYEVISKHFRGKWDAGNADIYFKRDDEPLVRVPSLVRALTCETNPQIVDSMEADS